MWLLYSGVHASHDKFSDLIACVSEAASPFTFTVVSNDHSSGRTGQYFNIKAKAQLGGEKTMTVKQCRNGARVWEGPVIIWTSNNGGSGDVDSHGRRTSGASPNQWSVGDTITTADDCPEALQ